jgi:hypothetical protein
LAEPYTLLGDLSWTNYTVSSDVMLEKSGYAQLIGRASAYSFQAPANLNAYYLRVNTSGSWSILSNNTRATAHARQRHVPRWARDAGTPWR